MNRIWSILLGSMIIYSCSPSEQQANSEKQMLSQDNMDGKTVLAIFAHPDDESSVGPLLAKYAREGAIVHLVSVTDGRYGVTDHAGIPAGDSLAVVREQEFICAGSMLGATSVKVLGYHDQLRLQEGFSEFWEGINEIRSELLDLFEVLEPDIVVTWTSSGWSGHPDHRLISSIVVEIYESHNWEKPSVLLQPGIPMQNVPAEVEVPVSVVDQSFLSMEIECSEEDLANAKKAWLCHESQYTPEQVEELWSMLRLVNGSKVFLKETR